jgi:uncharacterized protein YcsI (UPF0317 family)
MPKSISNPRDVRALCRTGAFGGETAGAALGHLQANLVVLEKDLAFDFLMFCQRNPKPCPLLDVTDPGDPEPKTIASGADIRTDLPRYRIYRQGELAEEVSDISDQWREDSVGFLIGCSFTFENALLEAGLPLRHHELDVGVPMYVTNIECAPAGRFQGPMVVSMRPFSRADAVRAVEVTSRYPGAHGAPIHIGDPGEIGVRDLDSPDFGVPLPLRDDDVPVFWACGVTPQAVAMRVKPELMITHAPGHMFVADSRDATLLH